MNPIWLFLAFLSTLNRLDLPYVNTEDRLGNQRNISNKIVQDYCSEYSHNE